MNRRSIQDRIYIRFRIQALSLKLAFERFLQESLLDITSVKALFLSTEVGIVQTALSDAREFILRNREILEERLGKESLKDV